MKALVVFDSNFGNSRTIAETVARELGARTVPVSEFAPDMLREVELLVVGGPVNWWRPSKRMRAFLSRLAEGQLAGMKCASYDTRVGSIFPWNDAKNRISRSLEEAGAEACISPRSFAVTGKKGPLAEGELENAVAWAKSIRERCARKSVDSLSTP